MKNKFIFIIKIVLLLGLSTYYLFTIALPEYKKSLGSSGLFIDSKSYSNMIEFNIDDNVNFGCLINDKGYLYHIFFFNSNSLCLYNKNIEGLSIDTSLKSIIEILIENNYLYSSSNIIITKYSDNYYEDFKYSLINNLNEYSINTLIIENTNTLSKKANSLGINDNNKILFNMDLYSKTVIYNNLDKYNDSNISDIKSYTDQLYKKLDKYVSDNNIINLEKDNDLLIITLIPIDSNNNIYPTDNSWYYVRDGKVYAYIEISDNNGYCYNGSINDYKKGKCN